MTHRTCDMDGCERKHVARGLCLAHWKRQHGKPTRYVITCETCGKSHASKRSTGRFCSDECKGKAYRRCGRLLVPTQGGFCLLPDDHHVMRLMARHPPRRGRPYLNIIVAGPCAWCGTTFCAPSSGGQARYCSDRCSKESGRAAYRARHGQFTVTLTVRMSVYERDNWTCQLCREPVDVALMGTSDDWAPSLDHIVCQSWSPSPDHSVDNLRLAHRWCNAVRGDGRYHEDLFNSPVA